MKDKKIYKLKKYKSKVAIKICRYITKLVIFKALWFVATNSSLSWGMLTLANFPGPVVMP